MKILITGSLKTYKRQTDVPSIELEGFRDACREIGTVLTQKGHTIVLVSDNEQTADPYIMEGIADSRRNHEVIVYYSEEPPDDPNDADMHSPPFVHNGKCIYDKVTVRDRKHPGPWHVAHTAAIKEADLVVLIGGGRRSAIVGHLASILQTPILAIRSFDGEAERVWHEFNSIYSDGCLSPLELQTISGIWGDGSATGIESAAVKLHRRKSLRAKAQRTLVLACSISLLSFILAARLLVFGDKVLGPDGAVLSLLFVFAVLGTSLRSIVAAWSDPLNEISMVRVFAELAIAVTCAIVFMLLVMWPKPFLTIDVSQLNTHIGFLRQAIPVSLIGFSVGFLLEYAVTRLKKTLLQKILKIGR